MKEEDQTKIVESFTIPGVRYEVDLSQKTCSCPAFKKSAPAPCKHLRSFEGLFHQSPEPDPNEALSAFIKSIRLRRPEYAVTWLLYLWRIPQYKGRAQRRLFIAAAEDNLSVGVMRRASAWYNCIERVQFNAAATEVARICATANWWAQEDGRAYIRVWLEADRIAPTLVSLTEAALYCMVEEAAGKGDLQGALAAFTALYSRQRVDPHRVAELLSAVAHRSGSIQAKRLTALYQANIRAIGPDGNLGGQALYAALVGSFGNQETPEPGAAEVGRLVAAARRTLSASPQIPPWALDGVHTGRYRDGRFAGTTRQMAACCEAYERFGRLSVDDAWPPSLRGPR